MKHDEIKINGVKVELIERLDGRLQVRFEDHGVTHQVGTDCKDSGGHFYDPDISDQDQIDLLTGRAFRKISNPTVARRNRILKFLS